MRNHACVLCASALVTAAAVTLCGCSTAPPAPMLPSSCGFEGRAPDTTIAHPTPFADEAERELANERVRRRELELMAEHHVERAAQAQREKRYWDAEKELKKALELLDRASKSEPRVLETMERTRDALVATYAAWTKVLARQARFMIDSSRCDEAIEKCHHAAEIRPNLREEMDEKIRKLLLLKRDVEFREMIRPDRVDVEHIEGGMAGIMPYGRDAPFPLGAGPRDDALPESLNTLGNWAMTDEVWIIERPDRSPGASSPPARADLVAVRPHIETHVPLPLLSTKIRGNISGFVARMNITQRFYNPFRDAVEATYIFPLPQDSAVTDFVVTVGERRIRALVRERETAERIYREARERGYNAALLTNPAPNLFSQRLSKLMPRSHATIDITYFSVLRCQHDEFELVVPMVVGPHEDLPESLEQFEPVALGPGSETLDKILVDYPAQGQRSARDIDLLVNIDAGMSIENVNCPSHSIRVDHDEDGSSRVALAPGDTVPNRDLVLHYRVAGNALKTALIREQHNSDNTFMLMLVPPASAEDLPRVPREMIFILDCSGSMAGAPLHKAKQVLSRCLLELGPQDSFQISRLSSTPALTSGSLVQASQANIRHAMTFLRELEADGEPAVGTALKAALRTPVRGDALRIVTIMTDGFVGNERELIQAVQDNAGAARVFAFGVGDCVNRYLIDSLAGAGRGAAAYVGLDDDDGQAVDRFYAATARPVLMDVRIDWGDADVVDQVPQELPDLFVGHPVVITGRLAGKTPTTPITVHGRHGQLTADNWTRTLDWNTPGNAEPNGIAHLWARRKLADMAFRQISTPTDDLRREMQLFSVQNRVLCAYTAFVAVDALSQSGNAPVRTINVQP